MGKDMTQKLYGIMFILLAICVSCMNDCITKLMGQELHPFVVLFFRFLFGCLSLLPVALVKKCTFSTDNLKLHLLRGFLGFCSFALFIYSLIHIPLAYVVMICWTVPLFSLLLSAISLKETISASRLFSTIVGFASLSCFMSFDMIGGTSVKSVFIIPVISSLLFAVQDVIIKKMVANEKPLTMLLYFSIITSILSFIPAAAFWQSPSAFELWMLFVLGVGGNLIQFFIFKAFAMADISMLAPFKYLEFVISAVLGFVFFSESVTYAMLATSVILIACTLYVVYSEKRA